MKTYIILLILTLTTLVSCKDNVSHNTNEAIEWIKKSKKPIIARGRCVKEGVYDYTLQSDDNNFW